MFPKGRLVLGLLILPALLLAAGCGLGGRIRKFLLDDDSGAAAVQVGDRLYSKSDLDRFFDSRLSEFRDPADADKVKSNLLESFVEDRLLLYQAESFKVEPNRQVLKSMMEQMAANSGEQPRPADPARDAELERNLTESLKMQQYLHEHLLRGIKVTEEECQAYYTSHLGDYIRNDVVHVREILVDDEGRAQKVQSSLAGRRNKNFAELARNYSRAPSAVDGGDLGSFQRGELPEEFEKVVFRLAPGNVSKIVRTRYGFHIFLVEERIAAHQQKFWEVKEQIRERLQQEREGELIDKELASLANRIPVKIDWKKLDFNYIGTRFSSR